MKIISLRPVKPLYYFLAITILSILGILHGRSQYEKGQQSPQIRNIGETQQQLIDAGYERVYVPEYEDFKTLKVDYTWGPITEAAYCQWAHDKVIARMSK